MPAHGEGGIVVRIRPVCCLLSAVLATLVIAGCQTNPRIYPRRHTHEADPLFQDDEPVDDKPVPQVKTPTVRIQKSKWKFIIVHHSATDYGNAAQFDKMHKQRGWKGVGYHFVIGNGTRGTADGQIEATFRWTKQLNGAHCKAGEMNEKAIGICLVGDFSEHTPSRKQVLSLIRLLRTLQRTFGIPSTHIAGHGDVRGAHTLCPGKHMPWRTIRANLLDTTTAQ